MQLVPAFNLQSCIYVVADENTFGAQDKLLIHTYLLTAVESVQNIVMLPIEPRGFSYFFRKQQNFITRTTVVILNNLWKCTNQE